MGKANGKPRNQLWRNRVSHWWCVVHLLGSVKGKRSMKTLAEQKADATRKRDQAVAARGKKSIMALYWQAQITELTKRLLRRECQIIRRENRKGKVS